MGTGSVRTRSLVGLALFIYTALSVALLASPVKDVLDGRSETTKLPRARRRLQRLADHWPNFQGSCGTSVGLQVTYTEAGEVEENNCYSLCESIANCVAFTVESSPNGIKKCKLATTCAIELQGDGIQTFVKPLEDDSLALDTVSTTKSKFRTSKTPAANACDFCPDIYGPCYGVPLCRNGQCFRGIPLANGKSCVAPSSGGLGYCSKGQCTDGGDATYGSEDGNLLSQYSLVKGQGCVLPSQIIPEETSADSCAGKCTEKGESCAAFSFDPEGSRCLIFPEAKCKMRRKSWTSGIKRQQQEEPQQEELQVEEQQEILLGSEDALAMLLE